MPISINELMQRLPKNTKDRVTDAKKRYLVIIQNEMRKETGLSLNRKTRTGQVEQKISLPVSIEAGVPSALSGMEFDDEYQDVLPLLPYQGLLRDLARSSSDLYKITQKIHANTESKLHDIYPVDFNHVGNYSRKMLDILDMANPVKRILEIHDDVLGVYRFPRTHTGSLGQPKIELYWGVIGLVAEMLGITPEALTCVVLTHELAHGYSHNGADHDGERWDTRDLQGADLELVEGVAQYYTHQICQNLDFKMPGAFKAYNELLKYQPDAYRIQLSWVNNYSPEIVRTGLVEARRNHVQQISAFEKRLRKIADTFPEYKLHSVQEYKK